MTSAELKLVYCGEKPNFARKHVANNLSCTRSELSELTTALLSQYTKMRRPRHELQWRPHNRRATTIAKASNKWIAGNRARTLGGNSTWKNSLADIPPQPVKQASVEKTLSGEDHNWVGMNETPLYTLRKWSLQHRMSFLKAAVNLTRCRGRRKERRVSKRRDKNKRTERTHLQTKLANL